MTAPAQAFPQTLEGRDLLVVPTGTDVLQLARAWFPDAVWTRRPVSAQDAVVRPMTGARFRGLAAAAVTVAAPGVMRLDATVDLHGPRPVALGSAVAAGLAAQPADVYELSTAAVGDAGAETARAWLVAAARRASGAVVPADRSAVVVPDRGELLDLTLWTAVPMTPQEAIPLLRPALAGGRVGDPRIAGTGPGPVPFSVTAMFEFDGALTIDLARPADHPAVLGSLDWRDHGPWAYRVAWSSSPDVEMDPASPLLAIARGRMRPVVGRAMSALWRAAGGTVVDAGGFVVTPDELRDQASQR